MSRVGLYLLVAFTFVLGMILSPLALIPTGAILFGAYGLGILLGFLIPL